MKCSVSAPRKRKGQPLKDCRDYVAHIKFTAQDEFDERMLAAMYTACREGGQRFRAMCKALKIQEPEGGFAE